MRVGSRADQPEAGTRPAGTSGGWGSAAVGVVRDRVAVVMFAVVLAAALVVYRVLLPIPSVTFSIALSVAFGAVFALQVHALRQRLAHRGGPGRRGVLGGIAFVISCLPCFIGLTPAMPALLTVFGVSAATSEAATGTTRGLLMGNLTVLLVASLVLLVAVAGWSFYRLAASERDAPKTSG